MSSSLNYMVTGILKAKLKQRFFVVGFFFFFFAFFLFTATPAAYGSSQARG